MGILKFRAWDIVTGKYLWPWPEGFHLFGEVTCFDLISQQLSEQGRSGILGLNDIIIEQFTGLHDKNGREIYDGDIVRAGVYDCLDDVWIDSTVHHVQYEGDKGYPAFDLRPHPGHDMNALAYAVQSGEVQIEIIGTVSENPELLDA